MRPSPVRTPPPLLRWPARSVFGLTESQRCDECKETVASDDGGAGRPPDREVGAYAARRPGARPPGTDGGIMAHTLRYYLDLLALRAGKGQGLVEYALIIVLISIVSIAIMTTLGGSISSVFSTANTALTTP